MSGHRKWPPAKPVRCKCGALVRVHSSDEGTSAYEPVDGRAKPGEPCCGVCGAAKPEPTLTERIAEEVFVGWPVGKLTVIAPNEESRRLAAAWLDSLPARVEAFGQQMFNEGRIYGARGMACTYDEAVRASGRAALPALRAPQTPEATDE